MKKKKKKGLGGVYVKESGHCSRKTEMAVGDIGEETGG